LPYLTKEIEKDKQMAKQEFKKVMIAARSDSDSSNSEDKKNKLQPLLCGK